MFFENAQGKTRKIVLSYDCPLDIAISYFFVKNNDPLILKLILSGEKQYIFIYNENKISIDDITPIGKYFRYNDNPRVLIK